MCAGANTTINSCKLLAAMKIVHSPSVWLDCGSSMRKLAHYWRLVSWLYVFTVVIYVATEDAGKIRAHGNWRSVKTRKRGCVNRATGLDGNLYCSKHTHCLRVVHANCVSESHFWIRSKAYKLYLGWLHKNKFHHWTFWTLKSIDVKQGVLHLNIPSPCTLFYLECKKIDIVVKL